ncbi:MAG: hypothetical protein GKC04_03580 [Methanomicrobiales archaeon]|nr:hypothetical protein [Methanomicrobiales archaeon]
MKPTAVACIMLALLILAAPVAAENQKGIHEPGTGIDATGGDAASQGGNATLLAGTGAASAGSGTSAPQGQQQSTATELQQRQQAKQAELNAQLQSMGAADQNVYRNQNAVRVAVHTLLGLGNQTGVGNNISVLANQFNNSVQASIRAESRIETRSGVMRFLAGGDDEAAGELLMLAEQNRERITEMNRLVGQCDCDEATRLFLQEQLQVMLQEQTRLEERANAELQDRGLFGWLWK